ncbi:MAG: hypothetical protein D6723_16765, partial [Acidobacteria bacterium]
MTRLYVSPTPIEPLSLNARGRDLRVCEGLESLRRIDHELWHGWWRHPLLNRQSGNVPEVMRVIDDRNP